MTDFNNSQNGNYLCVDETADISTCKIDVRGKGNRIKIGAGTTIKNSRIEITCNNCEVNIAEGCNLTFNVIMKLTDNNSLYVGKNTSCGGANIICGEGTRIDIGCNCMLAWGIEIRSTDSHGIFCNDTSERINKAENISISDDVWVAAHVTILRGTNVPKNSVVGIRSIVRGIFHEPGIIIAGIPAKIIRRNISWDRKLLG